MAVFPAAVVGTAMDGRLGRWGWPLVWLPYFLQHGHCTGSGLCKNWCPICIGGCRNPPGLIGWECALWPSIARGMSGIVWVGFIIQIYPLAPASAIELGKGIDQGLPHQVLLGATGTENVHDGPSHQAYGQPTLVLSHNKTSMQLYGELKGLFPDNAVYFVSYYDYYQPEAYVLQPTHMFKDLLINEHIDKLRHRATKSLWSEKTSSSSVRFLYLWSGSREAYDGMLRIERGDDCRAENSFVRWLRFIHPKRS